MAECAPLKCEDFSDWCTPSVLDVRVMRPLLLPFLSGTGNYQQQQMRPLLGCPSLHKCALLQMNDENLCNSPKSQIWIQQCNFEPRQWITIVDLDDLPSESARMDKSHHRTQCWSRVFVLNPQKVQRGLKIDFSKWIIVKNAWEWTQIPFL